MAPPGGAVLVPAVIQGLFFTDTIFFAVIHGTPDALGISIYVSVRQVST